MIRTVRCLGAKTNVTRAGGEASGKLLGHDKRRHIKLQADTTGPLQGKIAQGSFLSGEEAVAGGASVGGGCWAKLRAAEEPVGWEQNAPGGSGFEESVEPAGDARGVDGAERVVLALGTPESDSGAGEPRRHDGGARPDRAFRAADEEPRPQPAHHAAAVPALATPPRNHGLCQLTTMPLPPLSRRSRGTRV